MYEVILIDRENNKVGDIGIYDTEREANSEANNYNRKSDRHRGIAVVQAIIGGDEYSESEDESESDDLPVINHHRQQVRQNPERRGLSLGRRSQSPNNARPTLKRPPTPPRERPTVQRRQPEIPRHFFEEDSESESDDAQLAPPIQTHRPSLKRSIDTASTDQYEPKQEHYESKHILIHDKLNQKYLVLQDGFFTRQMLLGGSERYEVVKSGEFYSMIAERNKLNRGSRR